MTNKASEAISQMRNSRSRRKEEPIEFEVVTDEELNETVEPQATKEPKVVAETKEVSSQSLMEKLTESYNKETEAVTKKSKSVTLEQRHIDAIEQITKEHDAKDFSKVLRDILDIFFEFDGK